MKKKTLFYITLATILAGCFRGYKENKKNFIVKYKGKEEDWKLFVAICYDDFRAAEVALNEGANFETVIEGESLICQIVKEGKVLIMDALLKKHENVIFYVTDSGDSLLHLAAANWQLDMFYFLLNESLSRSISLKEIKNNKDCTLLHEASLYGCSDIIKLLLVVGAEIETINGYGCTALQEASWGGNIAVVQTLLDAGALIRQTAEYLYNPLHFAIIKGEEKVIRLLILKRPEALDEENIDGETPLGILLNIAFFDGLLAAINKAKDRIRSDVLSIMDIKLRLLKILNEALKSENLVVEIGDLSELKVALTKGNVLNFTRKMFADAIRQSRIRAALIKH